MLVSCIRYPDKIPCMQQAEEDGYPMYSPYVETDPLSVEDIPVKEDTDGPAWFFVVRCSR